MPPPDARTWTGAGIPARDHQVEAVAQPEGDALQHGAGQVAPVVADGQADERAPGQRVGVRAALAGQVGQEEQPVAARPATSPAAAARSPKSTSGRERVAEPAQAAGRREHHRHQVPAARDGVAERVHPARRLDAAARRSRRRRRPRSRATAPRRRAPRRRRRPRSPPGRRRRPRPACRRGAPSRRRPQRGHGARDRRALEGRRHPRGVDAAARRATSADQSRAARSNRIVPAPSALSMAWSPVRRSRT